MPNKEIPTDCRVHRIPGRCKEIHTEYGLWICSFGSNISRMDPFETGGLRYFEFYALSHMHHGSGGLWMGTDGPKQTMAPGDCVLMTPNTMHRYGASEGEYHEDTVCFLGKRADQLAKCNVIRVGIHRVGPVRRVQHIMQFAQDPAPESQLRANIELERLLFDLHTENQRKDMEQKDARIVDLIHAFKQDMARWWTIQEMADFCHVSRDHFQRVFLNEVGDTPKNYLDRLRFGKVSELLLSTPMSIADLAQAFGYSDPYHFSRRFKKLYGIAPQHYRQQFPSQ